MSSPSLIQYLLQKLKTWDSRSININAIPGKLATRFDISDLEDIDDWLVKEFLYKILNQSSFKFKIDLWSIETELEFIEDDDQLFKKISNKVSKKKWGILLKRLNSIISSEEDEFQEHWVRSFWFWYPLLRKQWITYNIHLITNINQYFSKIIIIGVFLDLHSEIFLFLMGFTHHS